MAGRPRRHRLRRGKGEPADRALVRSDQRGQVPRDLRVPHERPQEAQVRRGGAGHRAQQGRHPVWRAPGVQAVGQGQEGDRHQQRDGHQAAYSRAGDERQAAGIADQDAPGGRLLQVHHPAEPRHRLRSAGDIDRQGKGLGDREQRCVRFRVPDLRARQAGCRVPQGRLRQKRQGRQKGQKGRRGRRVGARPIPRLWDQGHRPRQAEEGYHDQVQGRGHQAVLAEPRDRHLPERQEQRHADLVRDHGRGVLSWNRGK
mmetsp:Transcript_13969/g.28245  ORF Transcript_13969/g.28245 Transcript_13969/m.28245 type:complete len:257 (+) Transcript_13969:2161-2931(+)